VSQRLAQANSIARIPRPIGMTINAGPGNTTSTSPPSRTVVPTTATTTRRTAFTPRVTIRSIQRQLSRGLIAAALRSRTSASIFREGIAVPGFRPSGPHPSERRIRVDFRPATPPPEKRVRARVGHCRVPDQLTRARDQGSDNYSQPAVSPPRESLCGPVGRTNDPEQSRHHHDGSEVEWSSTVS
jgi:hypothetical protein